MSSFPCKIIEADLDADIVTLQMEGDYTVSAGQKYLCDAAAASAEPVAAPKGWRLVPVSPTKEMLLAGETDEYDTAIWWDLMLAAAPAAPVTVQPDLTQQTLDDVKAGIPARDAEIEALRKEIEALQAAPVKPYSLDLDPAGIRALAADAISGALALGYQGVSPPPNNEHWLAPFWEIGRESAAQAQPLDIQPIEITDSMALAFHNAITDGSVGQEDVDDIKTGLRAVLANILDMRPQAQQPVSGADGLATERFRINGTTYELPTPVLAELNRLYLKVIEAERDHLPDATKKAGQDQFRDAAQMIEPSGNSGELNFQVEYEVFKDAAFNKSGSPIGLMDGKNAAWWAWVNRAALAHQDAETGKSVSVENQGVTQQDADKVQADLLSSLVEIVDAVIASDEEGLIEHSEAIIKARAAIDAARKEAAHG